MLFQLHPNSVSPEAATALAPPVVRSNENFFRCGTLKEISLTRRTSFPLFSGVRPLGSASSAEASLLTFRFLTEGSGEVDFRVKMYLPMSWRRVEHLGFLAGSWVSYGLVQVDERGMRIWGWQVPRASRTDLLSGFWEEGGKAASIQERSESDRFAIFSSWTFFLGGIIIIFR